MIRGTVIAKKNEIKIGIAVKKERIMIKRTVKEKRDKNGIYVV